MIYRGPAPPLPRPGILRASAQKASLRNDTNGMKCFQFIILRSWRFILPVESLKSLSRAVGQSFSCKIHLLLAVVVFSISIQLKSRMFYDYLNLFVSQKCYRVILNL